MTSPLPRSPRPSSATVYPDGPIRLRGDFELTEPDGTPIPTRRRVVALCRCGRSALAPICDGTHKAVWPLGGRRAARERRSAANGNGAEPPTGQARPAAGPGDRRIGSDSSGATGVGGRTPELSTSEG